MALRQGAGSTCTAAKIAPITEASLLDDIVGTCLENEIDYVVFANTIGNCYMEKPDGKPAIAMVRGGLSGPSLRPMVSGMLQMTAPKLKGTETQLIAVGGVSEGKHAYDYLKRGAHGFGFNTVLNQNGGNPNVADTIILGNPESGKLGLIDYLVEHGLPE